jgi:hypothetical protein
VAACLVSWLARTQIQKSEGAQGGQGLTTWGLAVGLVFGLNYAAYWLATDWAVKQQAAAFAADWLETIKKGNLDRAFVVSRKPSSGASGEPALARPDLEVRYNANRRSPQDPGEYSGFAARDYVRLMRIGGEGTQVELKHAQWLYEKSAYDVTLVYQVSTPSDDKFSLQVVLRSTEPSGTDPVRKWQVNLPGTGRLLDVPLHPGPRLKAVITGWLAAERWAQLLDKGDLEQAYLRTLPQAERQRQHSLLALTGLLPLLGKAPLVAFPSVARETTTRQAFLHGGLVLENGKYSGEVFWADSKLRADAVGEVKKIFQPGTSGSMPRPKLALSRTDVPLWKQDGNKVVALVTTSCLVGQSQAPIACEGVIVMEADVEGEALTNWRALALELQRAHLVTPRARPAMPGGAAGQP